MSQSDFRVQWNDSSPKVQIGRKKRKRKICKKKVDISTKRSPCFTSLRPPTELGQSGSDLVLQTPPLFKRMKLPFLATPEGSTIDDSKPDDVCNETSQRASTSTVYGRNDSQVNPNNDTQTRNSLSDDSFFERPSFLAASQAVLDELTKNSKFTPKSKKPEHQLGKSPDVQFLMPIVSSTPLTVYRGRGRTAAGSKFTKHKLKMDDSCDSQGTPRVPAAEINDSDDFCIAVDLDAIIGLKKIR